MGPKTTIWPLEPHTKGKHLVLKYYLNAWFPIMGITNDRILFIDGFAGPGKYDGGEDGSPVIAIRTLLEHQHRGKIKAQVKFAFIEKDEKRVTVLAEVLEAWKNKLPRNCTIDVIPGSFDGTMTGLLNHIDAHNRRLAPSFVMVDPFGVSDTPMVIIERILHNSRSEVYVSFMYEWMNRFKDSKEFEPHLDELFGTKGWRRGRSIQDPEKRKHFFFKMYETQLRKAGAEQVVHFELYEGNRLVYAIFFGTKNTTGSDRMKQAIWKVAPFGDFAFRGTKSRQLILGLQNPDFDPLRRALTRQFRGQGWVSIEDVQEFVKSDRTDYHSNHVKRVLKAMEMDENGKLEVDEATRSRKRTYPQGTMIRFR